MLPLGRSPTLEAFTGKHCRPLLRATYTPLLCETRAC